MRRTPSLISTPGTDSQPASAATAPVPGPSEMLHLWTRGPHLRVLYEARTMMSTSCWAYKPGKIATLPVKVGGTDTHALLDSGSSISLVQEEMAEVTEEMKVPVVCIHGDRRQYPTAYAHLLTPRGTSHVQVDVPKLPVPMIIGTLSDCSWAAGPHQESHP